MHAIGTEQFILEASAPPADEVDVFRTGGLSTYTLMAVRNGDVWVSLCRELDISSEGETAEEAIQRLLMAINEAVEVANEHGVAPGAPVPDDALWEFIESHEGPEPAPTRLFSRQPAE